jgi:hypothetical protein
MPKQNREDRRHDRFGGGRVKEQGGWPTTRPNPAFRVANADRDKAAPDDPATARPDKGSGTDTDAEATTGGNQGVGPSTASPDS